MKALASSTATSLTARDVGSAIGDIGALQGKQTVFKALPDFLQLLNLVWNGLIRCQLLVREHERWEQVSNQPRQRVRL